MSSKTIKTPYYFQVLEEVRGNRSYIPAPHENPGAGLNAEEVIHGSPDATMRQRSKYGPTMEVTVVNIPVQTRQEASKNKKKERGRLNLGKNLSHLLNEKLSGKMGHTFPLAKILFKNGEFAGREFYIYNINPPDNPAGYIKIGRQPIPGEQFFIRLTPENVSRSHAKIAYLKGRLIIVNHSEVNPTKVNGEKISLNTSVYLPDGAVVTVGEVEFTVEKMNVPKM